MARLVAVDYDPFASQSAQPRLTPVDYDPFAPTLNARASGSVGAGNKKSEAIWGGSFDDWKKRKEADDAERARMVAESEAGNVGSRRAQDFQRKVSALNKEGDLTGDYSADSLRPGRALESGMEQGREQIGAGLQFAGETPLALADFFGRIRPKGETEQDRANPVTEAGRDIRGAAVARQQEIAPLMIDRPDSLLSMQGAKYIAQSTLQSAPTTGTGLAAAVINPAAGLSLMGAGAGSAKFADARAEDKDYWLSAEAGAAAAAAEVVPEMLPLGFLSGRLLKHLPGTAMKRMASSPAGRGALLALSEGASEGVTELSNIAYEIAREGKSYSDDQIEKRLIDATAVGTVMGGGMAAVAEATGQSARAYDQSKIADLELENSLRAAIKPRATTARILTPNASPDAVAGAQIADDAFRAAGVGTVAASDMAEQDALSRDLDAAQRDQLLSENDPILREVDARLTGLRLPPDHPLMQGSPDAIALVNKWNADRAQAQAGSPGTVPDGQDAGRASAAIPGFSGGLPAGVRASYPGDSAESGSSVGFVGDGGIGSRNAPAPQQFTELANGTIFLPGNPAEIRQRLTDASERGVQAVHAAKDRDSYVSAVHSFGKSAASGTTVTDADTGIVYVIKKSRNEKTGAEHVTFEVADGKGQNDFTFTTKADGTVTVTGEVSFPRAGSASVTPPQGMAREMDGVQGVRFGRNVAGEVLGVVGGQPSAGNRLEADQGSGGQGLSGRSETQRGNDPAGVAYATPQPTQAAVAVDGRSDAARPVPDVLRAEPLPGVGSPVGRDVLRGDVAGGSPSAGGVVAPVEPASQPAPPALRDLTDDERNFWPALTAEIRASVDNPGGRMIVNNDGSVGRTKWADLGPVSGFWRGRPKGWNSDDVLTALDRASAGEKLTAKQKNIVEYAKSWARDYSAEHKSQLLVYEQDSRLAEREAIRDDIESSLPSVADTGPQQRASVVSLGHDYTAKLIELKRARAAGALNPDQQEAYIDLLEQDRETGKVAGRPMVGIGNKTAYVDALMQGKLMPVQVFLDADNFKALNDKFGHDVGDDAIRLIADVVRAEFGDGNVFHRGGDEFLTQGMTQEEVDAKMARVQSVLANYAVDLPLSDGRTATLPGIGVSYGTGANEKAADDSLKQDKQRRKEAGLRFDRREGDGVGRVGSGADGARTDASGTDANPQDRPDAAAEGVGDDAGSDAQVGGSRAGEVPADRVDAGTYRADRARQIGVESAQRVQSVRAAISAALGPKFLARLDNQKWFQIVDTVADLPPDVRKSITGGGIAGFVLGNRVFVVAEDAAGNPVGVLLHELGVHYGMTGILGEDFAPTLAKFKRLRAKDDRIGRAYERATEAADKDANGELTEAAKATLDEEALAYFVEENWDSPDTRGIVYKVIDAIKRLLNRLGMPLSMVNASPELLREVAIGAARMAADGRITVGKDGAIRYHKVWHGSPHDFDRFRLDETTSMTGEGQQTYGHGLYFTSAKSIGEYYRQALSTYEQGVAYLKGAPIAKQNSILARYIFEMVSDAKAYGGRQNDMVLGRAIDTLRTMGARGNAEAAEAHDSLVDAKWSDIKVKQGNLYEVEAAPDESEYLDWGKSLAAQSESVKSALEGLGIKVPRKISAVSRGESVPDGESAYRELSDRLGGDQAASYALRDAGVPGNTYIGRTSGVRNYVIFDDSSVKVVAKYSRAQNIFGKAKFEPWKGKVKAGTVLYHGSPGELDPTRDDPLYLSDRKSDAGAYAAGLIPGTGKGRKGKPQIIKFIVSDDARVLDANIRINDAVMEMTEETADEAIDGAIAQAKREGYDFVWFEHPSIDGDEMNALIAVDWRNMLLEDEGDFQRDYSTKAKYSRKADGGGASLAAVESAWDAAGISAAISERDGVIKVGKIVVPQDQRGRGIGTDAMRQLTDYADATGRRIVLSPSADFGGDKGRLVEFYKRIGFVENKGRGRDLEISETMYREPKTASGPKYSRNTTAVDGTDLPVTERLFREYMQGDLARELFKAHVARQLRGEKFDYEIRSVPVDDVTPSQFGEDYDNDSSRETARRIADGSVLDARPEDVYPIEIDASGRIVDGNHRHAAAVMNLDKKILALVPVSIGSGRVLNTGTFSPTDARIAYSRKTPTEARAESAQKQADLGAQLVVSPGQSFVYTDQFTDDWRGQTRKMRERVQDKLLSVRDAQKDIEQIRGAIEDAANVYRRENLMHGRVGDQRDKLQDTHVKPLIEAMAEAKVSPALLEDYLEARHAKERNEKIAATKGGMPDGAAGMTTAQAEDFLQGRAAGHRSGVTLDPAMTRQVSRLARKVYAVTAETRRRLLDSGQITQEAFDALENAYAAYVPLRGKDGTEGGKARGTGKGIDVRGKPVLRAAGRGEGNRAQNILAEVIADAERSIINAEKLRVGRTLARLVLENPNPDVWAIEPVKTELKVSEGTPEEIYEAVKNLDQEEGTIIVKVKGKPYRIVIEDQRMADALKNMAVETVPEVIQYVAGLNRYFSAVLTRYNPSFVGVNMTRDLLFGMTGIWAEHGTAAAAKAAASYFPAMRAAWRDIQGKPPVNAMGRYAREFAEAGGKTYFGKLENVSDMSQRIGEEFKTFRQMAMPKFLGGEMSPVRALAKVARDSKMVQAIEAVNDTVENTLRLSVYAARREAGASIEQAAEYAKNISVNFNRRGSATSWLNALYLFFNAATQGAHRTLTLLKNPKVQGVLGGLAALQATSAMFLMGLDDDDGEPLWDSISPWDKQRNLILAIPIKRENGWGATVIKIPMPYGFNLFPYMGGRTVQLFRDAQEKPVARAFADYTVDAVVGVAQAMSPIPFDDGWKAALPHWVRIFTVLAENKDDLGIPVRAGDQYDSFDKPRSASGRDDTPLPFKVAATALNRLGGGDDYTPPYAKFALDWAPEDLAYLFKTFAGGLGSNVVKSGTLTEKLIAGVPVNFKDVPVLSSFVSNVDQRQATSSRYYDHKDDIEREVARQRDRAKETGEVGDNPMGIKIARNKSGSKIKRGEGYELEGASGSLFDTYKQAEKDISRIRDEMRAAFNDQSISYTERIRKIDELKSEREEVQRELNAAWREQRKKRTQ